MYASDPVFSVAGRTVLITGACGLIGRQLVASFLERGATVVSVDITPIATRVYPAGSNGRLIEVMANVARASEVKQLVSDTVSKCGTIDILANCHHYKPIGFTEAEPETFPEELWDAIVEVNLKATFLMCRDVGHVMLEQGRGNIVNIASTYGVVSSDPGLYQGNSLGNPVAYSASKGGVIMLTKYLGAHWAARGVRVNCVTPHGVANHQEPAFVERFSSKSPMRRLMRADEIVGAVLFLASDASSYATGSNLLVEGGWTAW